MSARTKPLLSAFDRSEIHRAGQAARSAALWPPERVAQLTELVADGVTFIEIGPRVGKTKNAAIGKAQRLELRRREDAALTPRQAARLLGDRRSERQTMIERLDALDRFPGFAKCVYPIGNVGEPAFHFCGADSSSPLDPYCDKHHACCHMKVPAKGDATLEARAA